MFMIRRIFLVSVATSKPKIRAVPAEGRRSVVRILIRVVLPAPFGPEQAEELARGDLEVDPGEGSDVFRLGLVDPRDPAGVDRRGLNRAGHSTASDWFGEAAVYHRGPGTNRCCDGATAGPLQHRMARGPRRPGTTTNLRRRSRSRLTGRITPLPVKRDARPRNRDRTGIPPGRAPVHKVRCGTAAAESARGHREAIASRPATGRGRREAPGDGLLRTCLAGRLAKLGGCSQATRDAQCARGIAAIDETGLGIARATTNRAATGLQVVG